MTYKNDSPRRIEVQLWIISLYMACALVSLSLTRSEANASVMFHGGDGHGPISSAAEMSDWEIGDRIFEETTRQHAMPSLLGKPSNVVGELTDPHHAIAPDVWRSPWIDQDATRFNFNLFLQGFSHYGPVPLRAGVVDLRSRSPVAPVSSSPSSGVLFVTTLVGMLGTVFLGDSLIKKSQDINESEPHRPRSIRSVVVLSPDIAFSKDLEEHLHRAGYAVRVAATVNEIFALTDPASLLLVLVDHRIQDWDMLRTDPSLRHVLLMAVVPFGCLYTEDHCISDLERGMDGVHDLRDGHRLLVAKVGAYLRRAWGDNVRRGVYQVGAVELDGDAHEVKIAGRQVKLSAKPFAILTVLMREPSKVFSRSELVNLVWGPDFAVGGHAVDVHVHALRQQLDREPNRLCELVTIRKTGFKLKPVSSAGSIRTRRPRPTSNSISGLHTSSRRVPRFSSGQITRPNRGSLLDPPLKSPANICITSAWP
ncbi:MAG: winged helix-turn-helix transcriptional regulator [Nitrospiraceae bacterium]